MVDQMGLLEFKLYPAVGFLAAYETAIVAVLSVVDVVQLVLTVIPGT